MDCMAADASSKGSAWLGIGAHPSGDSHTVAWDSATDADSSVGTGDIAVVCGGREHCSVVGMGDGLGLSCIPFHVASAGNDLAHSESSSSRGPTAGGSPSMSRKTCETRLTFCLPAPHRVMVWGRLPSTPPNVHVEPGAGGALMETTSEVRIIARKSTQVISLLTRGGM